MVKGRLVVAVDDVGSSTVPFARTLSHHSSSVKEISHMLKML